MKHWQKSKLVIIFGLTLSALAYALPSDSADGRYALTAPSRDGIGKYYFGREIAKVMGHRGAAWLERKTRASEELPDQVVFAMGLPPDARVADIGAGTGYFTFRIAPLVPAGRVYAVDIQPEMIEIISEQIRRREQENVIPVLSNAKDPMLPAGSIDAVLLVDAYHEFAYPHEMMSRITHALRPGGRVFLVEYRGEDRRIPIKPLHKMTQQQAITEMQSVGLRWIGTKDFLPTQHFMIFEKPGET